MHWYLAFQDIAELCWPGKSRPKGHQLFSNLIHYIYSCLIHYIFLIWNQETGYWVPTKFRMLVRNKWPAKWGSMISYKQKNPVPKMDSTLITIVICVMIRNLLMLHHRQTPVRKHYPAHKNNEISQYTPP